MRNGQKVFAGLDAEWARLRWTTDPSVVAAWADAEPILAEFANAEAVVAGAGRRGEVAYTNAVVGALLRLAADKRAARTLLQSVLPGLAGRVRHLRVRCAGGRPLPGWDDLEDLGTDLVAMAVERIAALAGTSPPWPAAAVVGGAWRRARTVADATVRHEQLALPLDAAERVAAGSGRSAAEDLATELVDAVERRVLRQGDAQLIYLTRVLGYAPAELVSPGGPDARALRTRRARAERALLAASA